METKFVKIPNSRTAKGYHLVNLQTKKVMKSSGSYSNIKKQFNMLPMSIQRKTLIVSDFAEPRFK